MNSTPFRTNLLHTRHRGHVVEMSFSQKWLVVRGSGAKPPICFLACVCSSKDILCRIYDLAIWHSKWAVFCGSKSREGLISDDMLRRLVYLFKLFWVVAWFCRKKNTSQYFKSFDQLQKLRNDFWIFRVQEILLWDRTWNVKVAQGTISIMTTHVITNSISFIAKWFQLYGSQC